MRLYHAQLPQHCSHIVLAPFLHRPVVVALIQVPFAVYALFVPLGFAPEAGLALGAALAVGVEKRVNDHGDPPPGW